MQANSDKPRHIEAINKRLAFLEALERLYAEKKIKTHVYRKVNAWLSQVSLPFTQRQLDECFRDLCQHQDESPYARSQRALFAREMNRVLTAWHAQGLIQHPFTVRNFTADPVSSVLHLGIFEHWNAGQLEPLQRQFLQELAHPLALSFDKQWRRAFHHLTFALVVFDGFAVPNAFVLLARLQWCNLSTVANGYITLARYGTLQRVYVSSLTALCVLILGLQIALHRKTHSPSLDQPILPGLSLQQWKEIVQVRTDESDDKDSGRSAKDAHKQLERCRWEFNTWLVGLCQRAHLTDADGNRQSMNLRTLTRVAEKRMVEIYDPLVAGGIVGSRPYAQVPDPQRDIFTLYAVQFEQRLFQTPMPETAPPAHENAMDGDGIISKQAEEQESAQCIDTFITDLHRSLRPLFDESSGTRQQAIRSLQSYAQELGAFWGIPELNNHSIPEMYEQHFQHEKGTVKDVAAFNVMVIALWLADRCARPRFKTSSVADQRSDAVNLVRMFPERVLNELDEEDVAELIGTDRSMSGHTRAMGTLRQLRAFMHSLGLPLAPIDWKQFTLKKIYTPVTLLGQGGFARLLQKLEQLAAAADGVRPEEASKYASVHTAALLAFFFGLRVSETVRLTLSDMVLNSTEPYLQIWRSKRGRTRRVYAQHVPTWVLQQLKQIRTHRFHETADVSVSFLVVQGEPTQFAKELSHIVIETLQELGLRGEGKAQSVTFHTLRHEYANRLLVLGLPLLEIAKSMGHASAITTVGSYLHVLDYRQHQQLDTYWKNYGEPLALDYAAMGVHLNISPTAVLELIKRYRQKTGKALEPAPANSIAEHVETGQGRTDRKVLLCSDAVKLLVFRLGIDRAQAQNRIAEAQSGSTSRFHSAALGQTIRPLR